MRAGVGWNSGHLFKSMLNGLTRGKGDAKPDCGGLINKRQKIQITVKCWYPTWMATGRQSALTRKRHALSAIYPRHLCKCTLCKGDKGWKDIKTEWNGIACKRIAWDGLKWWWWWCMTVIMIIISSSWTRNCVMSARMRMILVLPTMLLMMMMLISQQSLMTE